MKKILILGGFGFLGKNLMEVFKESNYEIYQESRRTCCDILNINQLIDKIEKIKPHIIINAAAHVGSISYVSEYVADVCHDNSMMYINMFKAVSQTNKDIIIINPISNCSYPGEIDVQNEEKWWDGPIHSSVESYGTPKKLGFILSECYKKQYGIKTVNIILPNAYGPLDYTDENKTHAMNSLIIRMIRSKNKGEKVFNVWGSGKPVREWIYMLDAAKLIKQIIDENMYDIPNPLNIGQEFGFSINDTVNTIKNILEYNVEIVHDHTKQDGAPIKVLGKSKFNEIFPTFKFTPYEDGIKNTINYYNKIL